MVAIWGPPYIFVFLPHTKQGTIDMAWQQKLADKVTAAGTAKQDAQTKLAEAKRLVEAAIQSR